MLDITHYVVCWYAAQLCVFCIELLQLRTTTRYSVKEYHWLTPLYSFPSTPTTLSVYLPCNQLLRQSSSHRCG